MNDAWLTSAEVDPALMQDFGALCAFGGRLAGTVQEVAAMDWALERLRAVGGAVSHVEAPYDGWRCRKASLELLGKPMCRWPATRCCVRSAPRPKAWSVR